MTVGAELHLEVQLSKVLVNGRCCIMTKTLVLLSLTYFRTNRNMAFLHARLLEHLVFQFAPSALDEAALAGRGKEDKPKISVQLPSPCLPMLWQQFWPAFYLLAPL